MFGIHRFVRDTTITTGPRNKRDPESVLATKKRFLFPHERLVANVRREKTGSEEDGRSRLSCENATFFVKMVARAETRKSKERGNGIDLREKSAGKKEPQIRG